MFDYSRLNKVLEIALETYNKPIEVEYEQPAYPFQFLLAWKGQNEAIQEIIDNRTTILASHTGSGKSVVGLTAAHELQEPTLIIEPRKFLQQQLHDNYSTIPTWVVYGRKEYHCQYAPNANEAPCSTRYKKPNGKWVFDVADPATFTVMQTHYPCKSCEYQLVRNTAYVILKEENGIVITNFGNFWLFKDLVTNVVIDEADEFFRAVTHGIKLYYTTATAKDSMPSISLLLRTEISELNMELEDLKKQRADIPAAKKIHIFEAKLIQLRFLLQNADLCFSYKKKDRIYIELIPTTLITMLNRIFPPELYRLCLVTATPPLAITSIGKFVSYNVPARAAVVYLPIGKMTSHSLYTMKREFLIEDAYNVIKAIYTMSHHTFNTNKVLIHCGNLSHHAMKLKSFIEQDYQVLMHEQGQLTESLNAFLANPEIQFLLVTAAEHGIDLPKEINLQFVIKVPYFAKDERLRALEQHIGEEQFREWYEQEAISRLVQACGRVRQGLSIILDSKFEELYEKYYQSIPEWFHERLYQA